jgi:hypothetical protein
MFRTPFTLIVALVATAVIATGCADSNSKTTNADGSAAATPVAAKPRPEPPRDVTLIIPAGTNVVATLNTRLTTETNTTGDRFEARTIDAITVGGKTVVPAGATVYGVLRDVQSSGKISGRARMTLDFQRIDDTRSNDHAIAAQPLTLQADSNTGSDIEKIAAGGILGAIVGGIAGGKKGALIGAGAGAGAGTIIMLATQGDEIELESGQQLNVYFTSAASIVLVAQR